jgi:hypothetical protein
MSLNNIQLQGFIVEELYKDSLLLSPDAPVIAPVIAPAVAASSAAAATPPVSPAATTPPAAPTPPPFATTAPPATPPANTPPVVPPATKPVAGPSLGAIAAARSAVSAGTTAQTNPPPSPPTSATPSAAAPYKSLGNNRRNVTILVNAPGSPFLPDNQLNFLTKILEACRMNMGDIAIVNHAAAPVNITALREQLQPSVIILFGLDPVAIRLPINFPVFKLQPYDRCTYLSAPALDLLVQASEESKLLKSKLWVCLKSLFEV